MTELLSGWGRHPRMASTVLRPARPAEVPACLARPGHIIARGSGRAYGDAALGLDTSLHTAALDHVISFDPRSGRLHAEAGLRLIDLIPIILPHGWFPPVVPGTRYPSLGGMIAADIHGKNHHRDGSFGAHVEALRLLTASGDILDITPADTDIFRATIGGMGLTGIILSATIRLAHVETGLIRQTTCVAHSLAEAIAGLDAADSAHYSVAWIDCSTKGPDMGRALIYLGEHATAAEAGEPTATHSRTVTNRPPIALPFDAPGFALNRHSIKAFNQLYFRRGAKKAGAPFLIDHVPYFFPLDAIADWNRVYGKRGFVQHQCVLPPDTAADALAALMQEVTARGLASPLAVLKKFGTASPPTTGMLSFPMPGYTLALDFALSPDLSPFLARLDAIVAQARGRLYLAKDSCQPRSLFEAGYPELEAFRTLRHRLDPQGKFASHQSRRLGL